MSGVVYGNMPGNLLGYYDHSAGVIHINEELDRRERHMTLVHERFHKLLKHGPSFTAGVQVAREILVEGMTAEYLIPFRLLLDAFMLCSDAQAMAEFLNVDCELVYARMMGLSKLDRIILHVCAVRCIGVNLTTPHPQGVLVA